MFVHSITLKGRNETGSDVFNVAVRPLPDVQYLFPEFTVLLQEPKRSGLKPSQQDFELLLQFSCFAGLCCHVTTVHLEGESVWKVEKLIT